MSVDVMASESTKAPQFSKRMLAFVLDLFVLGFVMLVMQFTIPYVAPFLVWVAYKTLFECSAVQATPGKRAMDLMVVDGQGRRLTFGKSLLRTLVAFLSVFTCFLIYLVALFTKRQQAVHDLVADTYVVDGRSKAEAGKAWLDEVKFVFEFFRALFNSTGKSYLSEREKLELIQKLNALRTSGALSEAEYETRKRAILGET
jgi:uncharacterized RDD family membrane protein YckC